LQDFQVKAYIARFFPLFSTRDKQCVHHAKDAVLIQPFAPHMYVCDTRRLVARLLAPHHASGM
jgi:hypothetical protein